MAKVSICIPTYNNVESVKRLLQSIKEQNYTDYEVVITDDSDDERFCELVKDNQEIHYYKNQERLGSTANWNEAMSKSSGEYIKIMHHDDWFTNAESLGKLVRLLEEHPEADIAFCGTKQVGVGQSYERYIKSKDAKLIEEDYRNLYLGNTIGAPSATIYRSVVEAYDEKLTWLVDMEFYMNILKKNSIFIYTEEPLISIGVSKDQLTETCIGDHSVNINEYGYIYEKYDLGVNQDYKDKLMQILIDNEGSYKIAKRYGIKYSEYIKLSLIKVMGKVKWKLGIRG